MGTRPFFSLALFVQTSSHEGGGNELSAGWVRAMPASPQEDDFQLNLTGAGSAQAVPAAQREPETQWEFGPAEKSGTAHLGSLGPMPSATQFSPPQPDGVPLLPGYLILGILGRGGMGVVYQATQLSSGRTLT